MSELQDKLRVLAKKHCKDTLDNGYEKIIRAIPTDILINYIDNNIETLAPKIIKNARDKETLYFLTKEMKNGELLEDIEPEDVIRYFGTDIYDSIDLDDLIWYLDGDEVLDAIDNDTIKRYMGKVDDAISIEDTTVKDMETSTMMTVIKRIVKAYTGAKILDKKTIMDAIEEIVDFESPIRNN